MSCCGGAIRSWWCLALRRRRRIRLLRPYPREVPAEPLDDTVTSRTTLRLPDRLKARVEQAAAEEGVSVNSWFVRAIAAALEPNVRRASRRETNQGDSFTGWAR